MGFNNTETAEWNFGQDFLENLAKKFERAEVALYNEQYQDAYKMLKLVAPDIVIFISDKEMEKYDKYKDAAIKEFNNYLFEIKKFNASPGYVLERANFNYDFMKMEDALIEWLTQLKHYAKINNLLIKTSKSGSAVMQA